MTRTPPDEGLDVLVAAWPGPAVLLGEDGTMLSANAPAEALVAEGTPWLHALEAWLSDLPSDLQGAEKIIDIPSAPVVRVIQWTAVRVPAGSGTLLLGRDLTVEACLRRALTDSRERYRALVALSSDFAWETANDGRFVFVSPGSALGHSVDFLVGGHPDEILREPGDVLPLPFSAEAPVDGAEIWLRRGDGGSACVLAWAEPIYDEHGQWAGARGVCRDITDQHDRATELARVRSRERLLSHVVALLRDEPDLARALQGTAEAATFGLAAAGCSIFRIGGGDLLELAAAYGQPMPEDTPAHILEIARGNASVTVLSVGGGLLACVPARRQQSVQAVLCLWRLADEGLWDADDRILMEGLADQIGVAEAQAAYRARLRHLSETDELTGLLNRRCFFDTLSERLANPSAPLGAFLYVDLDNFKSVNDRHGHIRGDEALRAVAGLLARGVRPGDLIGRLGGDEFALWLDGVSEAQALSIADRLVASAGELLGYSGSSVDPLGMSVGVAWHPGGATEPKDLVARADRAMYRAKECGKGRAFLDDPAPVEVLS